MLLIRRLLTVALLLAAAVVAAGSLRDNPAVYVFARPVAAGQVLTTGDVTVARLPVNAIPEAALRPGRSEQTGQDEQTGESNQPDGPGRADGSSTPTSFTPAGSASPVGRVVIAAADAGEVVSESRILGPEMTAALVADAQGGDAAGAATMVPLKLADPDLVPLLHHGDTVTVVTDGNGVDSNSDYADRADDHPGVEQGEGRVIAQRARVISTAPRDDQNGRGAPSTILIALPEAAARAVAAASLNLPLTVVVTGERAGV